MYIPMGISSTRVISAGRGVTAGGLGKKVAALTVQSMKRNLYVSQE